MEDFESRVVEHGDGGWTLWVQQPGSGPLAVLESHPGTSANGRGLARCGPAALSLRLEDDRDGLGGSIAEVHVGGHEPRAKRIRFPRAHSSEVAGFFQRALSPGMMGIDAADVFSVLPASRGVGVLAEYPAPRAQRDMEDVERYLATQMSRCGPVSSALVVLPVDATMTPATVDRVAQSVTRNLSEGSDLVLAAPLSITGGEPMTICLFGE
ncbi:hypothetical protein TVD_08240 [Thioalkalivibrio versutus]|uniref:Uncharacterized protein n=1 Tax=Thioalkalivibrio versutus TaxID=106634 RepID=A0A0G3G4P4_9GAMM|nr:hypothetical protein TVD_08240 [Thioalkalivibrio versutus]